MYEFILVNIQKMQAIEAEAEAEAEVQVTALELAIEKGMCSAEIPVSRTVGKKPMNEEISVNL